MSNSLNRNLSIIDGAAGVSVPNPYSKWPVFSCPLMAGFGCPPRELVQAHRRPVQLVPVNGFGPFAEMGPQVDCELLFHDEHMTVVFHLHATISATSSPRPTPFDTPLPLNESPSDGSPIKQLSNHAKWRVSVGKAGRRELRAEPSLFFVKQFSRFLNVLAGAQR
jgi:hypothetical protein